MIKKIKSPLNVAGKVLLFFIFLDFSMVSSTTLLRRDSIKSARVSSSTSPCFSVSSVSSFSAFSSSAFSLATISTLVSSKSFFEGEPSIFLDFVNLTEKLESRPSPLGKVPEKLNFPPRPFNPAGRVELRGRESLVSPSPIETSREPLAPIF